MEVGSQAANTNPLHGIQTGSSPMVVVTLGQQYNTGEKPTVMLYTYIINRHAGIPDKSKTKLVLVHNKVGM